MFNIVIQFEGEMKELVTTLTENRFLKNECFDESELELSFSEWIDNEHLSNAIKSKAMSLLNVENSDDIGFEMYYSIEKFNNYYIYKFEVINVDLEESPQVALENINTKDSFISTLIFELSKKLEGLGLTHKVIC